MQILVAIRDVKWKKVTNPENVFNRWEDCCEELLKFRGGSKNLHKRGPASSLPSSPLFSLPYLPYPPLLISRFPALPLEAGPP